MDSSYSWSVTHGMIMGWSWDIFWWMIPRILQDGASPVMWMLDEKTPSKYSYLRIIHYGYYNYLHQLSVHELGPHPLSVLRVRFFGQIKGRFHVSCLPKHKGTKNILSGYGWHSHGKWPIYRWFTYKKWWFSMAMLNNQMVHHKWRENQSNTGMTWLPSKFFGLVIIRWYVNQWIWGYTLW